MAACVYRQWFLEVFLGPFSNVNHRIDEWCSVIWGPEDHGHPTKVFSLVLYAQRFLVSLKLLMMLYTVDDAICKAFATWHWGTFFFFIIPQSFYALFHRLESLCPSLLLRDSASLRHPFYVTDLMSNYLISCLMFSQLNLFKMSCFFSPLLSPWQIFWDL